MFVFLLLFVHNMDLFVCEGNDESSKYFRFWEDKNTTNENGTNERKKFDSLKGLKCLPMSWEIGNNKKKLGFVHSFNGNWYVGIYPLVGFGENVCLYLGVCFGVLLVSGHEEQMCHFKCKGNQW